MATSTEQLTSRDVQALIYYSLAAPVSDTFISRVSTGPITTQNGVLRLVGTGAPRGVRKFVAPRTTEDMSTIPLTVLCDRWETGFRIGIPEMTRDMVGLVKSYIRQSLSEPLQTFWYEQATRALELGTTTNLAPSDEAATAFFATTHARYKSGTQVNLTSTAITAAATPTLTELETSLWNLIGNFRSLKNDQGRPIIGQHDFTMVVPPRWEKVCKQLIGAGYLNQGGVLTENALHLNVNGNSTTVTLELNPFLTSSAAYYLLANDGRTMVLAQEHEPKYGKKAEGSDFEYDNDAHEHGVIVSGGIGLWRWESAQKQVFTTA